MGHYSVVYYYFVYWVLPQSTSPVSRSNILTKKLSMTLTPW